MADHKEILDTVRTQYSAVATHGLSSDQEGVRAVAEAFGYTADELASIPAEANMGLSCGNPLATARLRPGEVVVDLGCGGGLDVLLAAPKVGPEGKAIGIDMSEDMIALARRNAAKGVGGEPIENVEFHLSTIDRLPLDDASVDCVISNCVLNLAPDKQAVVDEVFRVLRPGGRLAVSDIALKGEMDPEVGQSIAAYVGCIAGAIPIDENRALLASAGFEAVEVLDTGADLNAYAKAENAACCVPTDAATGGAAAEGAACDLPVTGLPVVEADEASGGGCCGGADPPSGLHTQMADLLRRHDVNQFAASVRILAVKPG